VGTVDFLFRASCGGVFNDLGKKNVVYLQHAVCVHNMIFKPRNTSRNLKKNIKLKLVIAF
jgi:hypothetical protein